MNKFNKNTIAQSIEIGGQILPAIQETAASINKEFAVPEVPHVGKFDFNKEKSMEKASSFETTIDIFNIVVENYSDEVIIFHGDLTNADCAYIYEQSVKEEFPIGNLNREIIIGAFMHYDAFDWKIVSLSCGDYYEEKEIFYAVSELRLYALDNNLVFYPGPPRRKEDCVSQEGDTLHAYVYQQEDELGEYERFFDEYNEGLYHHHTNKSAPPVPKDNDIEDIPF